MKYWTIRAADMKTSDWSGGRTTEIFIHPEGASAAARDFEIRVSTATVDLDETAFSDYSGYIRRIMPIEGCFDLTFDGQDRLPLERFDATTFDGGRCVRSVGRCRDFNLIHRPRWLGGLRTIGGNDAFDCPAPGFSGVYALSEQLEVALERTGEKTIAVTLARGDCLIVSCGEDETAPVRIELKNAQNLSQHAAIAFIAGN